MLIIPNNKFEEFLAAINTNCQSDSEAGPRIRSGLGYQNQSTSKERGILHGWKVWDSIQKLLDLEKRPEFSRHIMHVHREWYTRQKSTESVEFSRSNFIYRLFHAVEECIYNEHLIFLMCFDNKERLKEAEKITIWPIFEEFSLIVLWIENVTSHPNNIVHNSNL